MFRIKCDLSAKLQSSTRRPPQVNTNISKAFEELTYATLKDVRSTGQRILLLVDISPEMNHRRCRGSRYVTLTQASAFLILYFLRTEPKTQLLIYSQEKASFTEAKTIDCVSPIKNILKALEACQQDDEKIKKQKLGPEHIHAAINSAKKESPLDICIIISHFIDCHTFVDISNFKDSEKKIKFVFVNLGGHPDPKGNPKLLFPNSPNIFIVAGFDDKIAKVIYEYISDSF